MDSLIASLHKNLWTLRNNNGLFELKAAKDGLWFQNYQIGVAFVGKRNETDNKVSSLISLNCGACTYKSDYPTDRVIELIQNRNVNLYCFQDICLKGELKEFLKANGYSYFFVPTINYFDEYSGMLVVYSGMVIERYLIYLDNLSFLNHKDPDGRIISYPQLGFDAQGVRYFNYYRTRYSSYNQRIKLLNQFLQITITQKVFYLGDFNCYGKCVDSRIKNYPGSYFWPFLPQILITIIFGINLLNVLELRRISNLLNEYQLVLGSNIYRWTYVIRKKFVSIGWVLDLVISNQKFESELIDGVLANDHKGLMVKVH